MIFYNEKYFNSNDNSVVFYNISQKTNVVIICVVFLLFWIYKAYILAMRFKYEKLSAFYGIWIYNDVASLFLNLAIVILTLL